MYVADYGNCTIRKVTAAGVVTTLAGSVGNYGSADGTGGTALFNGPCGVAVDGAGNVFVADSRNNTIRKVTEAGVVTTLSGNPGSYGSGNADGSGGAARFNGPWGVAVDGAGNVYVADSGNHTIRKITPAGVVTTLAGLAGWSGKVDGTGTAARFNNPKGVAVDGAGNVFVADYGNDTIRKVSAAGVVTTLAGTAGVFGTADGTGAAAEFWRPSGVAVDGAGNVFVADYGNDTIRKVTAAGVVTTLAGSPALSGWADGTGIEAAFYNPSGVAVDGAGNVFVADYGNQAIRKVAAGGVVTTLAGSAVVYGRADGKGGGQRFLFYRPTGTAVDAAGNVFVADSYNNTIRKVTAAGVTSTLAGCVGVAGSADGTGEAARFNQPTGVAVDGAGNLFVADYGNHTIRQVAADGVVTTLAGSAGIPGTADGTGSAAGFNGPYGVAVDGAGNIFVAEFLNDTIRKVTAAGVVTTLAGTAGVPGSADGTGGAALFRQPSGVAVDGAGNIFVADSSNCAIRRVTAAGVVTTLAGTAGQYGLTDGTGAAARFNWPRGLAVDGAGNILVADAGTNTIRKVTPGGRGDNICGQRLLGQCGRHGRRGSLHLSCLRGAGWGRQPVRGGRVHQHDPEGDACGGGHHPGGRSGAVFRSDRRGGACRGHLVCGGPTEPHDPQGDVRRGGHHAGRQPGELRAGGRPE